MKAKAVGYWICTALIAFIFVSSGVFYVMRVPQVVEGVTRLGFPLHFVTLLGVWKVLGGIAVLVPDFARVKEWAYAGMYFDLTGAAIASAASGIAWWHIVAPLAVAVVLAASWALRPQSRTLGVLFPVKTAGL
jgi:uncharacterized membrane protein YphA (DoxX/SURF4 family)